jgi:hypothetical protein
MHGFSPIENKIYLMQQIFAKKIPWMFSYLRYEPVESETGTLVFHWLIGHGESVAFSSSILSNVEIGHA